jgi:hypothetical protein
MLYTHAQDDAKQAALEQVSRVLFPNVPKLVEFAKPATKLLQ